MPYYSVRATPGFILMESIASIMILVIFATILSIWIGKMNSVLAHTISCMQAVMYMQNIRECMRAGIALHTIPAHNTIQSKIAVDHYKIPVININGHTMTGKTMVALTAVTVSWKDADTKTYSFTCPVIIALP